MPSALAFPIGSRFYDWKYESEPEPFMGGRRIYHARGKVLGGSSSINGMIFQRGNPLDYERWAADPGMETWDWAHCLPYFKRMETCLAAAPDDRYRGHDGPLIVERGPATNPLFGASSRRPSRRATRSARTSTATVRRASDRSIATSTGAGA
jgi:choline dehydrogenase